MGTKKNITHVIYIILLYLASFFLFSCPVSRLHVLVEGKLLASNSDFFKNPEDFKVQCPYSDIDPELKVKTNGKYTLKLTARYPIPRIFFCHIFRRDTILAQPLG